MSHNELCDGVSSLAGNSFTPMHVRDNTNIFICRAVQEGKAKGKATGKGKDAPSLEEGEEKGYLLIRIFGLRGWTVFTTCVS